MMRYTMVSMGVLLVAGFALVSLLSTSGQRADALAAATAGPHVRHAAPIEAQHGLNAEARARLDTPVDADLSGLSLREALAFLQRQMGVNMHVEARQIEQIGLDERARVSLSLRGVPASRLLRIVLDDVATPGTLDYGVVDGVVVISSAERIVELTAETRVYNVRDLVTDPGSERPAQLIAVIEAGVSPDHWARAGGRGRVTAFNDLLSVKTTAANHERIEKLLQSIRAASEAGPARAVSLR